jgi:hypothetical protein
VVQRFGCPFSGLLKFSEFRGTFSLSEVLHFYLSVLNFDNLIDFV